MMIILGLCSSEWTILIFTFTETSCILNPLQTVTAETTILWAQRVLSDFCKKAQPISPVKVKDIWGISQQHWLLCTITQCVFCKLSNILNQLNRISVECLKCTLGFEWFWCSLNPCHITETFPPWEKCSERPGLDARSHAGLLPVACHQRTASTAFGQWGQLHQIGDHVPDRVTCLLRSNITQSGHLSLLSSANEFDVLFSAIFPKTGDNLDLAKKSESYSG